MTDRDKQWDLSGVECPQLYVTSNVEAGKWAQQVADRSQQDNEVVHKIGQQEANACPVTVRALNEH